jgi:uncharacterized protein YkwD
MPQYPLDHRNRLADLLNLHNAARANANLGALTFNIALGRAACNHCWWMAATGTLNHTGENGSQLGERVSGEGYRWSTVAENIAAGDPTAAAVMHSWMNSTGHYTNIHRNAITMMGACCVIKGNGTPYWCVVFAAPL